MGMIRAAMLTAIVLAVVAGGCTQREVMSCRVSGWTPADPLEISEIRFYRSRMTGGYIGLFPPKPTPMDIVVLAGPDGQTIVLHRAVGLAIRPDADPVLMNQVGPVREEKLAWPDSLGWFLPNEIGRSSLFPKQIAPWPAKSPSPHQGDGGRK